MKSIKLSFFTLLLIMLYSCQKTQNPVLDKENFKHYIEKFNTDDEELHLDVVPGTAMITNAETWDFLQNNIPFFECPDKEIEEVYYYRWWTFRKHIKETENGYVITEFMPNVSWAGKYNTIPCPAAHHFREGRWLHNPDFIRNYGLFWLRNGGNPYSYSFWISDSYLRLHAVHPNDSLLIDVLPDLQKNYDTWEKRRLQPDGLFFQIDGADGMEVAVGGHGKRPTINTYMFADAKAISKIASIKGDSRLSEKYEAKAEKIRKLILDKLWDEKAQFFKVMPSENKAPKAENNYNWRANPKDSLAQVRELIGYVPWYLELPPKNQGYEIAWKQLMDEQGFYAPFGPTTTEQRHPGFTISYKGHECQWNGPSWPFATSQTLTALANVLNNYPQNAVSKEDFFDILKIYTKSHRFRQIPPKGAGDTIVTDQLWIDENLNPYTGDWLARTRMEVQGYSHKYNERGIYYNHSTYNDLIISGLIGLRPSLKNELVINPLIPEDWDWFCLDNILYKGKTLTIIWDKSGDKYGRGIGLRIFIDGEEKKYRNDVGKLSTKI